MLWVRNIIYYMLWASWRILITPEQIHPGGATTYSVI